MKTFHKIYRNALSRKILKFEQSYIVARFVDPEISLTAPSIELLISSFWEVFKTIF